MEVIENDNITTTVNTTNFIIFNTQNNKILMFYINNINKNNF